jgi:hypothetical protein
MLRIITLADGHEYATNARDGGLFCRRPDGSWQQLRGNGQTPVFRNARHLSRFLHEKYRSPFGASLARMVAARGWTDNLA